MENNGTTILDAAPAAEEQIQSKESLDNNNQQTESEESAKLFFQMTTEELLDYFAKVLQEKEISELKPITDQIKVAFYKTRKPKSEEQKPEETKEEVKSEEQIQNEEQNKSEAEVENTIDNRFKELMGIYRTKRDQFYAESEKEKESNYKAKLAIIEELKKITETGEILPGTYAKVQELHLKWKEIGTVPMAKVNDLWQNYNHYREIFYNCNKINKELRDIDLKKNYETKLNLCETAESLINLPSIIDAFQELQKLHELWRETGPVALEYKDQLWERFRLASTAINKRHQEYFTKIKEEQLENLNSKTALCEEVEKIDTDSFTTHKQWEEAMSKVLDIQKTWKTIGFTPKKENSLIYERFRLACDKFFEKKHMFTDGLKKELEKNYHDKLDLCKQAEDIVAAINEEINWKEMTDKLIGLQKKWKEIGPTARKYNDVAWTRFRSACDKFFDMKSSFYKESESGFLKNLEDKNKLIEELSQLKDEVLNFDILKQFQERWSAIGFVPYKNKEEVQKKFRETLDGLYKQLRGNETEKRTEGFRKKIASIKQSGKLAGEHERLLQKMHQLENQILTLENNIGFFGTSKKAEGLIREVNAKIQNAKDELQEIIGKIKILEDTNREQE